MRLWLNTYIPNQSLVSTPAKRGLTPGSEVLLNCFLHVGCSGKKVQTEINVPRQERPGPRRPALAETENRGGDKRQGREGTHLQERAGSVCLQVKTESEPRNSSLPSVVLPSLPPPPLNPLPAGSTCLLPGAIPTHPHSK